MDIQTCTKCGNLVEGDGIRHRRRLFCGDECCEAFEDQFMNHGGPDVVDLKEDDDDLEDDDLFDEDFEEEDGDDDLDDDDF